MKIVILDGGTTNPGDINWEPLEKLGELCAFDSTPPELVVSRAKDAEAVIMNRIVMSREVMEALPKLKFIGALATGYNTIDVKAARELGITVCNVPSYCVETVAQMSFALLLALCNNIKEHSELVRQGEWNKSIEASWTTLPIFELYGKTLGIVGFGNIGRTVAKLGLSLGMKVLVYNRTERAMPEGCTQTDKETLLRNSDVVSLHCALTPETEKFIDSKALEIMKPGALLINTARGGVVDPEALARALNSGSIAGAGLDVMIKEPPEKDDPLLKAKNCIITPHIAWASKDARMRLVEIVAENLSKFTAGFPQNVVS